MIIAAATHVITVRCAWTLETGFFAVANLVSRAQDVRPTSTTVRAAPAKTPAHALTALMTSDARAP